jgi:hypothetical protein
MSGGGAKRRDVRQLGRLADRGACQQLAMPVNSFLRNGSPESAGLERGKVGPDGASAGPGCPWCAPPPQRPLGLVLDAVPAGRAAFWATFGGWALDAYNQMTVGFVLPAVTAAFALSTTQAGLLGSVGMVTSAVGGAMAGALADAIGRVRVLILSIGSYALFTLLAGCAQSYEQLLVCLTLQGLGFGGEWAAGAGAGGGIRAATQRGRVVGPCRAPGRSAMPAS